MKSALSSHPIFEDMEIDEVKEYILEHLQQKFPLNGGLIGRVPLSHRDDTWQLIFLDLIEHSGDYDPSKSSFVTWAYWRGRGVITKVFSSLKKHGSYTQIDNIIRNEECDSNLSIADGIFDAYLEKDFYDHMTESLSSQEKNVLDQLFCKGLSAKEVANKLNISESKVRKIKKDLQRFRFAIENSLL